MMDFSTNPGPIPKRKYVADFEVYDERASDPKAAILDIFIGIEG